MNWLEFVKECERTMSERGIDPESVTMRIEVGDSYYDRNVTADHIHISEYEDGLFLVLYGRD